MYAFLNPPFVGGIIKNIFTHCIKNLFVSSIDGVKMLHDIGSSPRSIKFCEINYFDEL